MAMRWWFKAEKVDPPSEEPPQGKPIDTLHYYVLEEDDKYYYRLFDYGSVIYIYDMPTNYFFFLARQHAYDRRTRTFALHAEYRLTLTDDAKKIVNELLSKPFQCEVEKQYTYGKGSLKYRCITEHPVYIPAPYTDKVYKGRWGIVIYIERQEAHVMEYLTEAIPFNCGPLQPLWNKAVECWIDEIVIDIGSKYPVSLINNIRHELLKYKYIHPHIIPVYRID